MSILLLLYGISTPTAQGAPVQPAVVSVPGGGAGGVFTRSPRRNLPQVIKADRRWLEQEDEDVLLVLE